LDLLGQVSSKLLQSGQWHLSRPQSLLGLSRLLHLQYLVRLSDLLHLECPVGLLGQ
jgi:hypothetical protein